MNPIDDLDRVAAHLAGLRELVVLTKDMDVLEALSGDLCDLCREVEQRMKVLDTKEGAK